MNEDQELENEQSENTQEGAEEVTPPPRYVDEGMLTATLQQFGREMLEALRPPAKDEEDEYTFESDRKLEARILAKAEELAEAKTRALTLEMQRPQLALKAAKKFASEFGKDVVDDLAEGLSESFNAAGLKALLEAKDDVKVVKDIKRLARGIHAEKQGTPAPRSAGSGTVGGQGSAVNDLADQFWDDYKDVPGFTKEKAMKMAKDRI